MQISTRPHLLLRPAAFLTRFPAPLHEVDAHGLAALLRADASVPLERDERVRADVRDMLRQDGYKPTGRGKPASEYLLRAAADGSLAPINAAVDAGNVVSLHSGLPISVVDATLAVPPYRIAVAGAGEAYAFNRSGQTIDLTGLPCLYDANGACANAVKDAQRTKTHDETVATLTVIWGVAAHEQRIADALQWYRELLARLDATTEIVQCVVTPG